MNIFLSDSTYLISPLYTQVPKAPVTLHRFDFNYILKIPSTICRTTKLPRRHHLRRTIYSRDTVGFTCEGATDNPHCRIQPPSHCWKGPLSHGWERATVALSEKSYGRSHHREEYTTPYRITGREVHSSALVLWDPLSPNSFLELKYHSIAIPVSYNIVPLRNRTTAHYYRTPIRAPQSSKKPLYFFSFPT